MHTRLAVSIFAAAVAGITVRHCTGSGNAAGVVENRADPTFDGWTSLQGSTLSYSNIGVTDGLTSLAVTSTGAPNYGQMLRSPFNASYTSDFANAFALSFDIFTFPASFGNFCNSMWTSTMPI